MVGLTHLLLRILLQKCRLHIDEVPNHACLSLKAPQLLEFFKLFLFFAGDIEVEFQFGLYEHLTSAFYLLLEYDFLAVVFLVPNNVAVLRVVQHSRKDQELSRTEFLGILPQMVQRVEEILYVLVQLAKLLGNGIGFFVIGLTVRNFIVH